jgi:hypothetical protein
MSSHAFKRPAVSNRLLLVFTTLFLTYLTPVLVAIYQEWTTELVSVEPLPYGGQMGLACWLAALMALYVFLRTLAQYVPIKTHSKSAASHKEDILRMLHCGIAIAVLGGVSARLESGRVDGVTNLSFIPLVTVFTLFYTLLFEVVRDVKMTLSADMAQNIPTLVTFTSSLLVIIAVVRSHASHAWMQPPAFRNAFFGWTALILMVHILLFFVPRLPGTEGVAYLHLHHWYWPLPLVHLCVFPTDVSMLAQAMFLGVAIHGIACFGTERMFYDNKLMSRRPSLFEYKLKDPQMLDQYMPEAVGNKHD